MSISKKQKRKKWGELIGTIYSIAIYTVLYTPVFVMMMFSFNNQRYNYYWNGFTTQWYSKLFNNSAVIGSLWYSVAIAVLATVISVTIGTIGALGLKKYEFRAKKFINNMLYIPIIVPEIVMAVALLIIFMKIGLALGMGTILIGHCTFCIPYAVVTIKGRISGDGYSLEEASMDLGANRIQTFINVTLPSIMPGVMSAAFLSFTLSIDDVVMSNMLAGAKNSTDFDKDPVQLGFDLYVVPKGAKHVDLAEKFLNYITDPQVMAANLVEYPYSCPNDAAVEAASDTYKNDPARDFDYKQNVFFQEDVGEAITIYNDYYQKLKVGE